MVKYPYNPYGVRNRYPIYFSDSKQQTPPFMAKSLYYL